MGAEMIHRFMVPIDDEWHFIKLSGRILHVDMRHARVVEFWALVGEVEPVARAFRVFGTGQKLPDAKLIWWGSVVAGDFVWHLAEVELMAWSRLPGGRDAGFSTK